MVLFQRSTDTWVMKCTAFLALSLILAATTASSSQERRLTVASTTSITDAGVVDFLLVKFQQRTGTPVQVLSRPSRLLKKWFGDAIGV